MKKQEEIQQNQAGSDAQAEKQAQVQRKGPDLEANGTKAVYDSKAENSQLTGFESATGTGHK